MIFRNKPLQRFSRRNRRPRTRFGVIAVRPSGVLIRQPINRRNIFVRSGHFHARPAANRRSRFASRRQRRIRPFQILENPQIHALHVSRRRPVTAIQPHEHARMLPQNVDLALQRRGRNFALDRRANPSTVPTRRNKSSPASPESPADLSSRKIPRDPAALQAESYSAPYPEHKTNPRPVCPAPSETISPAPTPLRELKPFVH